MKTLNDWTVDELLSLPNREWDGVKKYNSLLIMPKYSPHDSGWGCIVIIGVVNNEPKEIVTQYSDDIEWIFPNIEYIGNSKYTIGQVRMDCCLESGALHMWSRNCIFRPLNALSTITIEVLRCQN